VRFLLEQGAQVDSRNMLGDTPLHLAAGSGHADIASALLAARADKDAQNKFGDTPLIVASRVGDATVVKALLAAGASTKLRNQDRAAAADVAQARDFGTVAALLKQ
jgi:ankyrin repeat protein